MGVRELARAKRVVPVLPEWHADAYPLHVVYASSAYLPAKIRAFADLMARSWRDR